MICGSHAPKSSSYMPQGQTPSQDRHSGPQGNLPPPPPTPQSGRQQNLPPRGDPTTPTDASRSMYMSRPAVATDRAMASPPPNNNGQAFQTKLPSPQSRLPSHSQPPARGGPWEQNRGTMLGRPHDQSLQVRDNPEDSFAGFLRYVAADLWKTCNAPSNDTHRFDERPLIRRGGA